MPIAMNSDTEQKALLEKVATALAPRVTKIEQEDGDVFSLKITNSLYEIVAPVADKGYDIWKRADRFILVETKADLDHVIAIVNAG